MNLRKDKYLLLYLKTGGGHLAPARSVAEQLIKYKPSIEPILVDGFEKSPSVVRTIIEGGYRKSQNIAKWVYELLYAIHKITPIAELISFLVSLFVKEYLKEIILKEKPVKIVIFHFFLIKPVYSVLSELNSDIKTFTVVTDPFTAHPLWFLIKKQNFIVFSDELKSSAVAKGINKNSIKVFPFILDEKFSRNASEVEIERLKDSYQVDSNKNIILIIGGGDGIPKGNRILELLTEHISNSEIFIVCGKNKVLFNQALALKRRKETNNLHVYGYVNFVYDLINISDVVITKCGASTFMEILISNKIPIVTEYIWEQEKGNKDFIVRNGMGIYIRRLKKLPEAVKQVLVNKSYYQNNIKNAELKNGSGEVAAYIASE